MLTFSRKRKNKQGTELNLQSLLLHHGGDVLLPMKMEVLLEVVVQLLEQEVIWGHLIF